MVRYTHPKHTDSLDEKKPPTGEPAAKEPPAQETLTREPPLKENIPLWRELRILMAAKLYASERLSSERAAKLAGIHHIEFLLSLGFYNVFPLQGELSELEQEHA